MNEDRISQIKDQIRDIMREISSMGEEPPEFIQDLLLQVIQKAQIKIQELREQPERVERTPMQNPPSNDAQLLWILAGQQPQAFISYLRNFPTPSTQQLVSNPDQLNATIVQLQQMMPQGETLVVDGVPQADLNSSNIWGTAYDPKTGKMRVRFQGGSEYEYDGVPANIYRAFAKGNASAKTEGKNKYGQWWVGKNPSLGAAMNQYIKASGFNYRKIK